MNGFPVFGRAFSNPSGSQPPHVPRATYGGLDEGLSIFTRDEIVLRIGHMGPKQKRFLTSFLKDTLCAEEGELFRAIVEGKLMVCGDPEDGIAKVIARWPIPPRPIETRELNHG